MKKNGATLKSLSPASRDAAIQARALFFIYALRTNISITQLHRVLIPIRLLEA